MFFPVTPSTFLTRGKSTSKVLTVKTRLTNEVNNLYSTHPYVTMEILNKPDQSHYQYVHHIYIEREAS